MKLKKILAFGLVAAMLASMAIGVSASSTVIREAAEATGAPAQGTADVSVEGIIEPTQNTLTDTELDPTDPSGTSDASSGWADAVVKDTSQLLVTAPTVMKFVVRGNGNSLGAASLVDGSGTASDECVQGTIKNASAYIPAADNASSTSVKPKQVEVAVKATKLTTGTTAEFSLLAGSATSGDMNAAISSLAGAVQGVDIQLASHTAVDFGATVNAATPSVLGNLAKGSVTTENSVYPSSNTIKFVEGTNMQTVFQTGHTGRLVNNYTMGLTFTYQQ